MKHTPYTVQPRVRDRGSVVLLAACIAAVLALFYVSTLLSAYRALCQFGGFAALIAVVYVIVRTRTPYVYQIEDDTYSCDESDLVIVRLHGKQRITACRLATKDIRMIGQAVGENRKSLRAAFRDKNVHNYCPTLFPERSLYLAFEDSDPYARPRAVEEDGRATKGEQIVIHIAYDETILAVLQAELKQRGEHHAGS